MSVRYMFSRSSRCISSFVNLREVSCAIRNARKSLLYEVEHDCLWYHVNHCSLDDVIVRIDEKFYNS